MTQNNLLIPISILLAGAMVSFALMVALGGPAANNGTTTTAEAPDETAPVEISYELDGFPSLGDADAPVTIVEYSDFACPYCKRFHEQTKPQIVEDYIEQGLVRFVRKDFIAVGGDKAAEAAHCAGDQGAYWEYSDHLMANQTADRSNWGDASVHAGYANELGLDADALVACFEAGTHTDKITASTREAQQNGGSGTPYFVINDSPVSGAQPYNVFQQVIDAELAEAE